MKNIYSTVFLSTLFVVHDKDGSPYILRDISYSLQQV